MILAAGCSWTDSNFVSLDQTLKDQDRGGWPMWPEVMGTKLGLETKNLGLAGCDNRYIFNSVIDEIWKHTKIDLCVVMWTGWDRFQYLNTWHHMYLIMLIIMQIESHQMKIDLKKILIISLNLLVF